MWTVALLVRLDRLAPLGGDTRALWSGGVAAQQNREGIVRAEPLRHTGRAHNPVS